MEKNRFWQSGLYRVEECDDKNKYFAGYDHGKSKEFLYEHREDVIWVDCGACVGVTILLYFAEGYRAKQIYVFEELQRVYKSFVGILNGCRKNLRKAVTLINKFIFEGAGWNSDIREKITLINADIEDTNWNCFIL